MRKIWHERAWDDYLYWQGHDKRTLKKINDLIRDIERDPFIGTGKPEPLKGDWQGYWSRRINDTDRIIYKIENNELIIAQCRSHYNDK